MEILGRELRRLRIVAMSFGNFVKAQYCHQLRRLFSAFSASSSHIWLDVLLARFWPGRHRNILLLLFAMLIAEGLSNV